ncbi:MFS transporter [Pseudonocardia spinosispora]|uniref:MFS transporter n=1 Tax=Pseudonocardia spinosispora TaxID=103441 RepID=UPI00040EF9BC|nr:MFS transporter [Pseudonocardia spinosispora]
MSEAGTSTGTIAARMDRLPVTRTHRMATVAIGLGMFFDIYEVFITPVLSSVLTKEFALSKAALTPILASTFIGMFLGALVMGRVADRLGRRRAFLLNLGLYSVFSLLGAFSPDPIWLMVTRFIAGIGLGAELPLADTYLTDLLPARKRGRFIAWAYTVSFVGVPFVGFLAHALVDKTVFGVDGWRWIFVIGSLGAIVVFLLRRGLPESPRWLESVGRGDEAEQITVRFEDEARADGHTLDEPGAPAPVVPAARGLEGLRVLLRPPFGKRTGMMVVFHVFQTIGYYGFGTMVPLVLAAKGYPVGQSLLFTALVWLGYPVGSALSLPLVERFERKFLVIGSVILMAIFGLAFGFSNAMTPILVFGFLYTAISNVFSNGYHIYQAEIFPTAVRSTAASGTYAVSRLATAAMPFVLVPVLNDFGAGAVFGVVCAAMVIVAVDIALLGPRTTGRTVESVSS